MVKLLILGMKRWGGSMIINHNIDAMFACRYMSINMAMMSKAMMRLSSGKAIDSASDNPAGLAISERMKAQIRGLEQASKNAQDAISTIQVADGALNETTSMLQRMKELATQAANGTLSEQDRKNIQCEINQLTSAINDIGNDTEFNTIKLFNSDAPKYNGVNSGLIIQVGANSGQTMVVKLDDMRSKSLNISGASGASVTSKDGIVTAKIATADPGDTSNGVTNGHGNNVVEYALDVTDPKNASSAIKIYSDAIDQVSSVRGRLGATQNALEYRIDYLNNAAENLTEAESRITDADMAKEMMNYAKYNVLFQVAQAMLAQTMHQSEGTIQLLKSLM